MNCKKCKLTKLQFQNYLNTNCFIFIFQIIDCPMDAKCLQSLWFQWFNIIEILHDIIKHKLIMYNANYNKMKYVSIKQLPIK